MRVSLAECRRTLSKQSHSVGALFDGNLFKLLDVKAPPHLRAIHVGAVGEIEHLVFLKKAGAVIEDSKIEDDEEITKPQVAPNPRVSLLARGDIIEGRFESLQTGRDGLRAVPLFSFLRGIAPSAT